MGKRVLSRKEFILTVSAGIAGISLPGTQTNDAGSRKLYPLGKSGIMVSRLCFEASLPGNGKLLEYAIENGINFIDTARTYGNGNNERIIGYVIPGIRKDIVISTKIKFGYEELKSGKVGKLLNSEIRSILERKTEESMTAMKTEYIDVLLIHDALDENLLFNDTTMNFFSDMKRSGIIRACGFSANEAYPELTERNNREGFYDVIMIPFSHQDYINKLEHKKSGALLSASSEKGTGIIAMKVTGRNIPLWKNDNTNLSNLKWALDHEFISSAVIVTDDFDILNDYTRLL
jgi:aryl-alcohol dehydrogenase-like predicted oxidoreductase